MNVIAKDRQTLLDVALQWSGGIETVVELASANGLCVTDRLEDGQKLRIPEGMDGSNGRTVALYQSWGVDPATEASAEESRWCPYGGIGEMCVGVDFVVD